MDLVLLSIFNLASKIGGMTDDRALQGRWVLFGGACWRVRQYYCASSAPARGEAQVSLLVGGDVYVDRFKRD
eukprot:930739-Rhodomonas_salina.1